MKRSEVVERLSSLISNSGHIEVPSSRYYDADALAEEVLQFIEKIGMQPPPHEIEILAIEDNRITLAVTYNNAPAKIPSPAIYSGWEEE